MSRKVEFLSVKLADGSMSEPGKRVIVPPREIVQAFMKVSSIDPRHALGSAQHEASFTRNERDTEPSGYISDGLYQLCDDEKKEVGMPDADLLTLEGNTAVFAALCAKRERLILDAWEKSIGRPVEPQDVPRDIFGFLAMAHNEGTEKALKSVVLHKMNWAEFKAENQGYDWGRKISAYGDDCISGGYRWSDALLIA